MKFRRCVSFVALSALLLTLSTIKGQNRLSTVVAISSSSFANKVVYDEKGVPMVYIQAGSFLMGETAQRYTQLCEALLPQANSNANVCQGGDELTTYPHQVNVQSFYLDQYEVSVDAYRKCIDSHVCDDGAALAQEPTGPGDVPIQYASAYDATVYCAWRNARLPSEEEWEYAARGPQNFTFPWGNQFDYKKANFCDTNCPENSYPNPKWNDGYAGLAPVNAFENGKSWSGAYNLAGNIAEWTSTIDGTETNDRVYKGGYYAGYPPLLASWTRDWTDPTNRSPIIGIRCARTFDEKAPILSGTPESITP